MKKLTMESLLSEVKNCGAPVGAAYLSNELESSAATIGRMLKRAEDEGYLKSISNKGRVLTEEGETFLANHQTKNEMVQSAEKVIELAFSDEPENVIDVLELRKLMEPHMVRLATERATDEDKEAVKDIDFEHQYVLRKGGSGSEEDLDVHLKFAELSGNKAMYQVLRLLLTENDIYDYLGSITVSGEPGSYSDHEKFLKAYYVGDADEAAKAMEAHIDNLIKLVKKHL